MTNFKTFMFIAIAALMASSTSGYALWGTRCETDETCPQDKPNCKKCLTGKYCSAKGPIKPGVADLQHQTDADKDADYEMVGSEEQPMSEPVQKAANEDGFVEVDNSKKDALKS